MSTPVCWRKTPHGNPVTHDPRYVTCHDCMTTTSFLSIVIGGATRAALRAIADRPSTWLNVVHALMVPPRPVPPCGFTRDDHGFVWRCAWSAHDGTDHMDPAYGVFPGYEGAEDAG